MIKILSNDTIQKIAAGEVVESPVSIVKELVENSIDASAESIIVEIKSGGKEYIKVSDDGFGIANDDLDKAFIRHATSKISEFEDLFNLYSMGFRGEALASISSVASVEIKTRNIDEDLGNHAYIENNKIKNKKSIAMNNGTTIEVSNLFSNIPARKKFLSSDIAESNKISQLMHVFAIGHKNISFTYIKDNREVFKTNKNHAKDINQEILFGKDFKENKIELETKSNHFSIYGSISNSRVYKGNRSMQYLFVNNRYINSNDITQAIESSYNNYIPNGRFPMYEIHIDVDPKYIDVNIHPNKQRIKISYMDELLEVLKKEVSELLYKSNRPKELSVKDENKEKKISFHELNSSDGYKRVLDAYKEAISPSKPSIIDNSIFDNKVEYKEKYIDDNSENIEYEETYKDITNREEKGFKSNIETKQEQVQIDYDDTSYIGTLFSKYLIFESSNDEKINIIDIDRANQRLIYDNANKDKKIISQELIEPIIISLTSKEIDLFNQNQIIFSDAGYEIDQFDETSIAIRQIPYFFSDPTNIKQFKDIFDGIESNRLSKESLIRKSITKAIHKKKHFNREEAEQFYKELKYSSNQYQTESGKNIIYTIDKTEFENFINR